MAGRHELSQVDKEKQGDLGRSERGKDPGKLAQRPNRQRPAGPRGRLEHRLPGKDPACFKHPTETPPAQRGHTHLAAWAADQDGRLTEGSSA